MLVSTSSQSHPGTVLVSTSSQSHPGTVLVSTSSQSHPGTVLVSTSSQSHPGTVLVSTSSQSHPGTVLVSTSSQSHPTLPSHHSWGWVDDVTSQATDGHSSWSVVGADNNVSQLSHVTINPSVGCQHKLKSLPQTKAWSHG